MTRWAGIYADALYTLAQEEALAESIFSELTVLHQSFSENPEFLRLLSSRKLTVRERCAILDDCFREKIHRYLLSFLKILTEKGYIQHFGQCFKAYEARFHQDSGILTATAVTAVALTPEQAEALTGKLRTITGKQVILRNPVDPSVLGGIRLDFDGKRLDDTTAHRLASIHSALKSAAL